MTDPRFADWLAELPPELEREPNPYIAADTRRRLATAENVCVAACMAAAHAGFQPDMDRLDMATVMVRTLGIYLGVALQPDDNASKALAQSLTEGLAASRRNPVAALMVAKAAADGWEPLKRHLATK